MAERKRVNKQHPDYDGYISRCEALWSAYRPKFDTVEKSGQEAYPDWRGKDSPWAGEERDLTRKMHAALKELQREYAYLFEDVGGVEEEKSITPEKK